MLNFNWNKRNTIIAVSVAIYAVLAMIFMVIINNEAISGWLKNVFSVLAPLIIGCAIAYLCNPIMKLFETRAYKNIHSRKARRALSLICTYLVIALVFTVILLIVIPQLSGSYASFIGNLKTYTDKAITFVNKLIYKFDIFTENDEFGSYIDISDIQKKVSELFTSSSNLLSTIGGYIVDYGTSIAIGVKNVLLGLFLAIYILSSKERITAQLKRMLTAIFGKKNFDSLNEWVGFANVTFGRYIKAQLLDALLVALECAVLFSIAGVPYSVLLAFVIGITNIIPVFGPFIGGIPGGFIVFITQPDKLIIYIILLVLIQQIDGNFVLPKLVGSSTGMTSLGVLCAIIVVGGYFGIVGMILGVPLFVVIGEIMRRLINRSLEKKGLAVSLADYYTPGADIPEEDLGVEKKDGFIVKGLRIIGRLISLAFHKFTSLFKKNK